MVSRDQAYHENPLNRVSLIVPVFKGGNPFKACLSAIRDLSPAPYEIIVVVDGDDADSKRIADEFGFKILSNSEQKGPASARNLGAANAKGDILFFTDADVLLPINAISVILQEFKRQKAIDAIIGSYDHDPFEKDFFSQFKNLFHHYVHQNASEKAATFWGACGAIKNEVFKAAGGFDEMYKTPSIEDIELGYRLIGSGFLIRMVKSLKVKHLKKWSLKTTLLTDIFHRAVPWTRLLLIYRSIPNDLNLHFSDRISSLVAIILLTSFVLTIKNALWLWPVLLCCATLILINRKLYKFFYQINGLSFAVKSILWHWFYYLYSIVGFFFGCLVHLKENKRSVKKEKKFVLLIT